MKILIGTPIHQVKDYAMERWLANVAQLSHAADLFLVDNSPTADYIQKVRDYCQKYGLQAVVKHLDLDSLLSIDQRIEASQETIRQYALVNGYDAWFSWECDQIVPPNALDELIKLAQEGGYSMVIHDSKARWDNALSNTNMGLTLIKRNILEKIYFLPKGNGELNLNMADSYDINNPSVIKKRVLTAGGSYVEVYGKITPIYHLNK